MMTSFTKLILLASFITNISHAEDSLDVNDVSYLWPPVVLKRQAADLIQLSSVLSLSVFTGILDFSKKQGLGKKSAADQLEHWHIVAMRIDPCAPKDIPTGSKLENCLQEIRLVAQPFSFGKNTIEYFDFSLHLIFQISEGHPKNADKFFGVFRKLVELKHQNKLQGVSTTGVPLRVHPAFKLESFRSDLKNIVIEALKLSELKKITFLGADTAAGPWLFFQGLVLNDQYVLEPDPKLRGQSFGTVLPKLPGEGGVIEPLPSNFNWPFSEDNGVGPSIIDLFTNGEIEPKSPAQLSNGSKSRVLKVEDIPHAIDNPHISDRTNTDCFSCHTSMSRAMLYKMDLHDSPFRFKASDDKVTLDNLLATDSMTNFRIFGWFGSRPVVSNRVIFESAQVLQLIERYFSPVLTQAPVSATPFVE